MHKTVTRKQAEALVGQRIVAAKKDGSVVTGTLVRISGNRLILQRSKGKDVHTKAIIPLVLFDLLAIGTAPFAGGFGFGGGYGGAFGGGHPPRPGAYGGYGPGPSYGPAPGYGPGYGPGPGPYPPGGFY